MFEAADRSSKRLDWTNEGSGLCLAKCLKTVGNCIEYPLCGCFLASMTYGELLRDCQIAVMVAFPTSGPHVRIQTH